MDFAVDSDGGDQKMDMIWHDGEAVELELALKAIAEECSQEQVGVGFCCKVRLLMKGRDRDGIGL